MRDSSKKANRQKGDELEDYVAYLYEGFGYSVQRDVLLHGQQVDVLATRLLPGAGLVRIAVECKYVSKGKVSNQSVIDFSSFVVSAISRRTITKGAIVTNGSYTRFAKTVASEQLELLVLAELENDLFSLAQFYRQAIAEYESEAISEQYVPLDAFREQPDSQISNVQSWLLDLLTSRSDPPPSAVVLADYGAGKTTLLRRLFYDCAVAYVEAKSRLKPLYLELKNLSDSNDIDAFVSSALRGKVGIDMPSPLFWRELRRGGFLVLLDGFDEMSPQIDRDIRMSNFIRISSLFRSGSPAVVTCRPSYFISSQEYNSALAEIRKSNLQLDVQFKKSRYKQADIARRRVAVLYTALHEKYVDKDLGPEVYTAERYGSAPLETIFLQPFSESQIQKYLLQFDEEFRAKCKRSSIEIRDFLLTLYDLRDLMRKPILLSMIKDTILLKGEDFFEATSDYGPATLYELYTNLNFDIDWAKGHTRRFLTREERRSFAQALAIAMFDNSKLEVSYEELLTIVNKNPRIMSSLHARVETATQEQVAADVAVCAFITRTQNEDFRFVHKSYMEFFLASFLSKNYSTRITSARLLPKEIIYFLGSFARLGEPIGNRIKNLLYRFELDGGFFRKRRNVFFRSNVYRIYLYSTDVIEDRFFPKVMLDEIDLIKARFENVSFARTSFYHNQWENCYLKSVKFADCQIDDSALVEVTLEEVGLSANISNCRAQRMQVYNSLWDTSCECFELEDTVIQGTAMDLRGTVYFRQSVLKTVEVFLPYDQEKRHSHIEFLGCNIESTVILATPYEAAVPEMHIQGCKFLDTAIFGVMLSTDSFENLQNTIGGVHGFVFISAGSVRELSTRKLGKQLELDTGLCWLSETLVVVQWELWKEGKISISNKLIQRLIPPDLPEVIIINYMSRWQSWFVN